jgi:uncharacterized protein (TIGR02757 family)
VLYFQGQEERVEKVITKEFLEDLWRRHHRLSNLSPDPLVFARGYKDPLEGEAAGLIAAVFAYGRVEQIMKALGFIFGRLGSSPLNTLLSSSPKELTTLCEGFYYRFHKAPDLVLFLHLLSQALEKNKSLRELFLKNLSGEIGESIAAFCGEILSGDCRPLLAAKELPKRHPVRFLLSSPSSGGAGKRLCLFLRWMVRKDELDPGYWRGALPTSNLVVPLDVHVARVGKFMGLTSRKDSGWKTAVEITASLRRFDPGDPLRYDFSLFRYGMKEFKGAFQAEFSPSEKD